MQIYIFLKCLFQYFWISSINTVKQIFQFYFHAVYLLAYAIDNT